MTKSGRRYYHVPLSISVRADYPFWGALRFLCARWRLTKSAVVRECITRAAAAVREMERVKKVNHEKE